MLGFGGGPLARAAGPTEATAATAGAPTQDVVDAERMLTLKVEPKTGRIWGSWRLRWQHKGPDALDSALLYLVPEHYSQNLNLDDILNERVFPGPAEPGQQRLTEVHWVASDGRRLALEPSPPNPQQPALAAYALPEAADPGEWVQLEGQVETLVPRRHGSFGRAKGRIWLNGGLGPLLVPYGPDGAPDPQGLPPEMTQSLSAQIPPGWSAVVNGTLLGTGPIERSATGRWWSLTVVQKLETQALPLDDGATLLFVGAPLGRVQKRWLRTSANAVLDTLKMHTSLPPVASWTLVETPMRRRLVELGEGVLFVSDRLLEVQQAFWRFEDLPLAQGLLADRLRTWVETRETPTHAPLVLDGLAWSLVPRYLKLRWKDDLRLYKLLKRLSFFPQIDVLLEAPIFPFADQLLDSPHGVDPLRADIRRFNRPLRSGRLWLLGLEDRIGADLLNAALLGYLADADPPTLLDHLKATCGYDGDAMTRRWLGSFPRLNLRLGPIARSIEDGGHRSLIPIETEVHETGGEAGPVEVRARSGRGKRTKDYVLQWDMGEGSTTWDVRSEERIRSVIIDPRGRLLEMDTEGISQRRDNRRPVPFKIMGYGPFLLVSATTGGYEAVALLRLRPRHDNRFRLQTLVYSNDEILLGGNLGFTHSFGPRRLGSYRRHHLGLSAELSWANGAFRPTTAPLVVEMRLRYIHDSRSWALSPTRGGRFEISVFGGRDFQLAAPDLRPLGEASYVGVELEALRLFRLRPGHVLGLRGKAGAVFGAASHRQFPLGGNDDLRGVPENHRVGPYRLVATVEWRHHFFRDLDLRFLLSRIRGLQGSLFVEGGWVPSDPEKLPQLDDAALSIGYGVRVFLDWFGLLPAMGGIDVAWSPGMPPGRLPIPSAPEHWPEVPIQVYLVYSQSF